MSKPKTVFVKQALNGNAGEQIIIKGWVRTRRDSKAGFSFINVHDGSCFEPIQVVADNTLANYNTEILKLTTACAVICSGKLVEGGGKNKSKEIQATRR